MSTLKEFLISLNARGIQIYVDDGKLKTRSEPGAITEDIANGIRQNKDALIELLQTAAVRAPAAPAPVRATGEERQVLSFAQQRTWFLDQFGGGSAHYNMPMALRLSGRLDRHALQATLDRIVHRHEILRTTYHKTGTGGTQRVLASASVQLPLLELSGLGEGDRHACIEELMRREASTPFDLSRDLMIRVSLAQLAADEHILFITLHHIAADGWSLGILVKEFVSIYSAFAEGQASSLPDLQIQYADYAHWQRQTLSGEVKQRHLQYWRDALAGVAQLHNIPTDRPRPVRQRTVGAVLRSGVDAGLLSELKLLASRQGASLFMVLQSAFSLLLARWSDDADVVVGTPVAGRGRKEAEDLIGCFINTLALRSTFAPCMSFEQLLAQCRASTLAAYEHQDIPFEMVVEGLNPPRSMSHAPLFQVLFALQNYEVGALQLPGLTVEELTFDAQNIKFDIATIATEVEGSLRLLWTYVEGMFDPATIESMASSYLTLLRAIVEHPSQDIHRLALLSPEQAAAAHALAYSGGQGGWVCDGHGAIQPVGAVGYVTRAEPQPGAAAEVALSRTDDIGRMRPDGSIEILRQRHDDTAVHGHRISVRSIEQALLDSGLVESVAVVQRRRGDAGQEKTALIAYVIPRASHVESLAEQCRDALKHRVPDFMLPDSFISVDALPRTADGVLDLSSLPLPDDSAAGPLAPVPPRHELEARLCEIWCTVLSLESVGIHDNFFDVGGSSLHSIIVQQEILARTGLEIEVTDLFTYPTVARLARYLLNREQAVADMHSPSKPVPGGGAIAIIGMSGRFPEAADVESFWENIKNSKESLTVFSDEELLAAGVDPALLNNPNYVKSGTLLDGIKTFDAAYFGFTPREAEVMDPQQRLLFECAVEALEQGGYGDDALARSVGVYVGTGESQYLFEHLLPQSALLESMQLAAVYGNRPDYAATRLSYRLNLSGPSVTVGTACSTSLVAVHEACKSLLSGESEMALAGGVSIAQLGPRGYLYQEGGIASPDGHCRAFDRSAAGTRSGSGAGLVLLKRLQDAIDDGDTIHAVIKGSAVNNDGADKVGYTAPSVLGQARAIAQAQAAAGVAPESIQYMEAHGTGTPLGDPIEVRALTKAFGPLSVNSCALSAVKTNIGHLDSAAGVAGLIKAAKALAERQIPPTINFNEANPQIDFGNGPFYMNTELRPWPAAETPRRAGVSSFGIGGTNAHVVLEEAPVAEAGEVASSPQLLVLSAKTATALATMAAGLPANLKKANVDTLSDVAYTLQVGRAAHGHRLAWVAGSTVDAADALADSHRLMASPGEVLDQASVVFMFTGQGAQYCGMAAGLYHCEPLFRDIVDSCATRLEPELGMDLRRVMFADDEGEQAQTMLSRTDIAQPALFVLEYALAKLLASWGVHPEAMIGHSLGEYVAACLAGVFCLEDALKLVAARGRLMQQADPGSMLSIALSEEEARKCIEGSTCCLAAINGPTQCVVSGPSDAIKQLAQELEQREVSCSRLNTSHAFHSRMMEDAAARLADTFRGVALSAPSLPYISNVSGNYIRPEEATDPDYWVRHLLSTVRFAEGLGTLASDATILRHRRVFLEVGPGMTLASLLRKNLGTTAIGIACIRHRQDERSDEATALSALGQLWVHGVSVDWHGLHKGRRRRRVPLPTYPFERQHYWIDRQASASVPETAGKLHTPNEWFYAPVWAQLPVPAAAAPEPERDATWLIFADRAGVGECLRLRLAANGCEAVTVLAGKTFARSGPASFEIDAATEGDYRRVLAALDARERERVRILHLWSADGLDGLQAEQRLEQAQALGFGSVLFLARACNIAWPQAEVHLNVVTRNVFSVTGEEDMTPEYATLLGLCKVIPQEYPQFSAYHVDLASPASGEQSSAREADRLFEEISTLEEISPPQRPFHVAHRGRKRWGLRYEPCQPSKSTPKATIRKGGTYVLTGGLGKIGLLLARALAERGAGAVVLIGRTALPARETWAQADEASGDRALAEKLEVLRGIESLGTKVAAHSVDAASFEQMQEAFAQVEREFGSIHGVVHGAGKVHDAMRSLEAIDDNDRREQFLPKIFGTVALGRVLESRPVDFCMLMSSLSSVLGGLGFGAYAAANSYLDAYAQWKHHQGDTAWMAVNWDGWLFAQAGDKATGDRFGMTPEEGVAAFDRALAMSHLPQVVNSTGKLEGRLARWVQGDKQRQPLKSEHARPTMQTAYQGPRNAAEERLVGLWQELLGFDQVGIHDNFFELGGDSILITKLLSKIRSQPEFDGADLKLKNLFEMPTVAKLSEFIEQRGDMSALVAKSESLRAKASVVEVGEV